MEEYVLRTKNLSKLYKNYSAVDNVNMNIKRGEIYGFIGENGAGKTSLIRMITGLATPSKGDIELFGETSKAKNRKRIGALIERPAFYPDMTAYQNLEACRLQKGIPNRKCIDEILEVVNLSDFKNKKSGEFSLGMKQKLGLAMTLIGDPEFLILDEPINGLDPMGIVEVRKLLKRLNYEKNITILISSHILGELHQLATCYGIIHKGKLLEEFTSDELDDKCKKCLLIKVNNVNKAAIVLEKELNTTNFTILPDESIKLYEYIDNTALIISMFSKANVVIEQITPSGETLEEYFMKLLGGADKNV